MSTAHPRTDDVRGDDRPAPVLRLVDDEQAPAARTAAQQVQQVRPRLVGGVRWTVELAEQILRQALPSGAVFLRALVEGGTATATRLLELTGQTRLNHTTLTLNTAARHVLGNHNTPDDGRLRIAVPRPDPATPRSTRVHGYTLPAELIEVFDAALRRIGH